MRRLGDRRSALLCVDVEPPYREPDRNNRGDWDGLEGFVQRIRDVRSKLELATQSPVHFNWFLRLDPQIEGLYGSAGWPVDRYRHLLDEWIACGDDIGIHTHCWKWDAANSRWLADYRDQAWIDHCVQVSVETYRRAFGRRPRSFRFGDRWMNDRTMMTLERLGIRYDITLEPGHPEEPMTGNVVGSLPDCTLVPKHPYRPSRFDYSRPARLLRRKIWVIPVSTGCLKRSDSTEGTMDETITLNLALHHPTIGHLRNTLVDQQTTHPLVVVVRSGDYASSSYRTNIDENLSSLADNPRSRTLSFVTAQESLQNYRRAA